MPAPKLVALSSYRQRASWAAWEREAALVPAAYVDCVAAVGARPVVVPPAHGRGADFEGARRVVEAVDAMVLVGGADVDPARYGDEPHERTGAPQPGRDDNELALLTAALESAKPVLAICRGMQLLNVHLGGTLDQHIPDALGHEEHQPAPGCFGEVKVHASAGTAVQAAMGEHFTVACCHHQAVDVLGRGLVVAARSDDDVVEAIELEGAPFVVGVQWHPEETADLRLFEALVAAC